MNICKTISLLLFALSVGYSAYSQDNPPAAPATTTTSQTPAASQDKTKFFDKIGHWIQAYLISGEDFMAVERNTFKSSAFAEVYVEGLIDHNAWLWDMLNRVTKVRNDVKVDPYVLFSVKYKPASDNFESYKVSFTITGGWGGKSVNVNLENIQTSANREFLLDKSYNTPGEAEADLVKAIGSALKQLKEKLGRELAPNVLVRYNEEIFWTGHQISILDDEGNSVELEAIDKDLKPIASSELIWTNADHAGSKGIVDMTDISTKTVTVSKTPGGEENEATVEVKRAKITDDINNLLKQLIIEALAQKRKEAQDSILALKADSTKNLTALNNQVAALEMDNYPLSSTGGIIRTTFESPQVVTAADSSAAFSTDDKDSNRRKGFFLLRQHKKIASKIKKKVNIVALADLVVDKPEEVKPLLEALLKNSGRLIAQLILNKDGEGRRESARNIVVDFINKNIESIAGDKYGINQPATIQVSIPEPQSTNRFDPSKHLYISSSVDFEGKEEFMKQVEEYLDKLSSPKYAFINYSQDISSGSYTARANGDRPKDLPANTDYVVITIVNIPGSIKYQLAVSGSGKTEGIEASLSMSEVLTGVLKGSAKDYYADTQEDIWVGNLNKIACATTSNESQLEISLRFVYGTVGPVPQKFSMLDIPITAATNFPVPPKDNKVVIVTTPVKSSEADKVVFRFEVKGSSYWVELTVPAANAAKLDAFLSNTPSSYFENLAKNIPVDESQDAYSQLLRLPPCSYSYISAKNRAKYLTWIAGEFNINDPQERIVVDLVKTATKSKEVYPELYKIPGVIWSLLKACTGQNKEDFLHEIVRICAEGWPSSTPKGVVYAGKTPKTWPAFFRDYDFVTDYIAPETGERTVTNYIGRANWFANSNRYENRETLGVFRANLLDPVTVVTIVNEEQRWVVPLIYPVRVSDDASNALVVDQLLATANLFAVGSSVRILVKGGNLLTKSLAFTELTKTGLDAVFNDPGVAAALNKTEGGKTFLSAWQVASIVIDLTTIGADVLQSFVKNGPEASKLLKQAGKTDAALEAEKLALAAKEVLDVEFAKFLKRLTDKGVDSEKLSALLLKIDDPTAILTRLDAAPLSATQLNKFVDDLTASPDLANSFKTLSATGNEVTGFATSWKKALDSEFPDAWRQNPEFVSKLKDVWDYTLVKGTNVKSPNVVMQPTSFTKVSDDVLAELRKAFVPVRKQFCQMLGNDPNIGTMLKKAGLSDAEVAAAIQTLQNQGVPDGYNVHHIRPLTLGGANEFSNLILIKNNPYHTAITSFQNSRIDIPVGQTQIVNFPIPNGRFYSPPYIE